MRRLVTVILLAASAASSARAAGSARVAGSKHDLSRTGPGELRAAAEPSPCVFCHVSHDSGPGLTGRPDIGKDHRPYESGTMSARPGAPTGASRICLSCHDGTIAVGQTRRGNIKMAGGGARIPPGHASNLGTDLRKTHPISFRPSAAPATRAPDATDAVRLDAAGQIQCTSCHDPHREWLDPEIGKFLVKPSRRSGLCLSCHEQLYVGPPGAAHATSTAPFPSATGEATPFATLEEAGCAACHVSHGADVQGQLVKRGPSDDAACLRCHASGAVRTPLGADVGKPSAHSAKRAGDHDAGEGRPGSARPLPEVSAGQGRHVACVDCHDPHAALPSAATSGRAAPALQGALTGAWGIDINGDRVEPARYEYEICLKCHGDSANAPTRSGAGAARAVRGAPDRNLRLVFDPSSPSFHPVAAPGRGTNVPSLKTPMSTSSLIYCTDCHASDSGPAAGGSGARGPHGSIYPFLLERQYSLVDLLPESPAAYALCYKCHDREKLLSAESAFPYHDLHVRTATTPAGAPATTPCATCHDAHGVSSLAGNDVENAHLVDFDQNVVKPGAVGERRYQSDGPGAGSCTLTCHGQQHDAASYGPLQAAKSFRRAGFYRRAR